jgi:hypothetical protein
MIKHKIDIQLVNTFEKLICFIKPINKKNTVKRIKSQAPASLVTLQKCKVVIVD